METSMMPTRWRVVVVRQPTLEEYSAALQARLNELSKEAFSLYRMEPMRVDVHVGHVSESASTRVEWFSTVVIGVSGPVGEGWR